MKRAFKVLFGLVIVVVALGVGLYYFGTKMASEKVMNQVAAQLENSGELENIKQKIKLVNTLESKLTEEEILALKVLAYKELNK